MTIKVKFYASIGYSGCNVEDVEEIKIDDSATQEEIDEIIQEWFDGWLSNQLNTGVRIIERT